jgi:hypothetical protein
MSASGLKQTSLRQTPMSAFDPKRTSPESLTRLRTVVEVAIDANLAQTMDKFHRYAQSLSVPFLLRLGIILRSGRRKLDGIWTPHEAARRR